MGGRGATVGFASLVPPEGSTVAVESIKVSSTVGIAPEVEIVAEAAPRDLSDDPMLGSTFFICVCRYLR